MALTTSRSLSLSAAPDDWRAVSACRDTDPDLFFPVGTTGPAIEQIDNAKAVKWLVSGAQPTERVERLLKTSGAWDEFAAARAK